MLTHIIQVKVSIGVQNNRKDGEDNLQQGELEGAKLEQEKGAPGGGTEETI